MNQFAVCLVKNRNNDKSFVFKSYDSSNRWDRFKEQLDNHCFHNQNLQKDWDKYGPNAFLFEIKESITDKSKIDTVYNQVISSLIRTYNEKDFSVFFNKPLKSTIEKLKIKLDEKTSDDKFNTSFKLKLNELNLDNSDILEFKKCFMHKIESGEVNNTNFDDYFELLLNKYSQEKQQKLNEEFKLLLFEYINKFDNSYLENFDLNDSDIDNIKLEIKQLVIDNKINSEDEISNTFEKIANEIHEKNKYKEESYEKLDKIINSYLFTNELKRHDLSDEHVNNIKKEIKNEIKSLIDKDMISHSEIDTKIHNLLSKKVIIDENLKEELKNHLYSTIGDENLNIVFQNRLTRAYLHKHVAYEILIDSLNMIDAERIKNKFELDAFIDKSVKEKERNYVLEKLNELSLKDINNILKMNNLSVFTPSKSSRINKIIESVPPNIIRNNMKELGSDLKIKYVNNPYIIFCSECGSKVYYDDVFCHNCGVKL